MFPITCKHKGIYEIRSQTHTHADIGPVIHENAEVTVLLVVHGVCSYTWKWMSNKNHTIMGNSPCVCV